MFVCPRLFSLYYKDARIERLEFQTSSHFKLNFHLQR